MADSSLFSSFVMGGFECTYAIRKNIHGKNEGLDKLKETRHDILCRLDYQELKRLGIHTVREGLSWRLIDRGQGNYDFTRFEQMMRIAQEEGVQQIWDLNHFDYPTDLDPFSNEFIRRFAYYASEAVQVIRRYQSGTLIIAPVNEIGFFAWLAGDHAGWAPFAYARGIEFTDQLVRAALAAMDAIRKQDTNVRFLHIDPVLHQKPADSNDPYAVSLIDHFRQTQFDTWDLLSGKQKPELGGKPDYLDLIGVNYYVHNQEYITPDPRNPTSTITYTSKMMDWDDPQRIPFLDIVRPVYERYHRPIIITETGAYGGFREDWWHRTLPEIEQVRRELPLLGVCLYPIVDYRDWGKDHLTHAGIWDVKDDDPLLHRIPYEPSLRKLMPYIQKWNEA